MTKHDKIIVAPIISFILLVLVLTILQNISFTSRKKIFSFDKGWEIYQNGVLASTDSLAQFKKDSYVVKGDKILLTRVLKDNKDEVFPALIFKTEFTAVEIYLDGDLIYDWCTMEYASDKFVVNRHHLISFNTDFDNTRLSIYLYPTQNGINDFCTNMYYGDYYSLQAFTIDNYSSPLFVGIFLIVFGASLLFISIIFYSFIPNLRIQIFSSLLCFVLGIWLHCFYDIIFIFMNDCFNTVTGFTALNVGIPIVFIILSEISQYLNKHVFTVISISSIAGCILFIIMNFAGIANYMLTLPFTMLVGGILILIIWYEFIMDTIKHKMEKGHRIILYSLFIPSTLLVICLIIAIIQGGNFEGTHTIIYHLLIIATIIYAMCILLYYTTYVAESYALQKEYESLSRLAYADGLTDLPNRSLYEKDLQALDHERKDYCIISLDLNGLKETNDKQGHNSGDCLIKDFSTSLKHCFSEIGTCYRIGGDEFTVILKNSSPDEVESHLNKLTGALQAQNVLSPKYVRSVAYGYAFKHETVEANARSIYLLADKRMYAMKRDQHERLKFAPRV